MTDVRLRIIGECAIEVGDRRVTPESSHLFALLLYLCVERGRAISRSELCELLFPNSTSGAQALHNLRQLLYRLRTMRAPVRAGGSTVTLALDDDICLLGALAELRPESRSELPVHQLAILPAYEPSISAQFSDWLESVRHRVEARLRALLLEDFRALRRNCNWRVLLKLGDLIKEVDEANREVASGIAEALAMIGRRAEAIAILDQFLTTHVSDDGLVEMRALRARIGKVRTHVGSAHATLRGRHDALASLRRMWASARSERPTLSVVLGAPGIGKTRLATEFAAQVALDGGKTLTYRCDASDTERPLAAFSQLVPQMRSMRGALGVSPAMQRCLDLLSADYTTPAPLEPAAVEWIRGELPLAIKDLAEAVSAEQPLLIVLDDAHLLHGASWSVLNTLCDARGTASVLVVCCCRGAELEKVPSSSRALATVISLAPLDDTESRAVLQELMPADRSDPTHVERCVAQAAGNPFYLHALAQHDVPSRADDSVPFDIRQLASSSYFALETQARALLEACLFLGKFATLRRVREVVGVDSRVMLTSLRLLEDQGLLTGTTGTLSLSHALLEEAIRPLVPTSVATALHDRVATCLQAEYDSGGYSVAVAWAAADHWLLAGDSSAAHGLLRRCAAQAAALGEPQSAVQTLRKIPLAQLPPSDCAQILDDTIVYADFAGDRVLMQTLLDERLRLAQKRGAPAHELDELEFRILEVDLKQCGQATRLTNGLAHILENTRTTSHLRVRAGICLLICADILCDEQLTRTTIAQILLLLDTCGDPATYWRARLIIAVSLWNHEDALRIICELATKHPSPRIERSALSARHDMAFALSRLGYVRTGNSVLLANYAFAKEHHLTGDTLYSLLMLAENTLDQGALTHAEHYLQETNTILESGEPRTHPGEASFCLTAASLALLKGDWQTADGYLARTREVGQVVASSRLHSVLQALDLLVKVARGDWSREDAAYMQLIRSYERGGHLGGQDKVVEALWVAARTSGSTERASALLLDYLRHRRRERSAPQWSLRRTTEGDPAWRELSATTLTDCNPLLNRLDDLFGRNRESSMPHP